MRVKLGLSGLSGLSGRFGTSYWDIRGIKRPTVQDLLIEDGKTTEMAAFEEFLGF